MLVLFLFLSFLFTSCRSLYLPAFYSSDDVYTPIEIKENEKKSNTVSITVEADSRSSSSLFLLTRFPVHLDTYQFAFNIGMQRRLGEIIYINNILSPSLLGGIAEVKEDSENQHYYSFGGAMQLQSSISIYPKNWGITSGFAYTVSYEALGDYREYRKEIESEDFFLESYNNLGETGLCSNMNIFIDVTDWSHPEKLAMFTRVAIGSAMYDSYLPFALHDEEYVSGDEPYRFYLIPYSAIYCGVHKKNFYYIKIKIDEMQATTLSIGCNF